MAAPGSPGHLRSTSFSISYAKGKHIASPTADMRGEMRGRSGTDADARFRQQQQHQMMTLSAGGSLSRSRSAQSLKLLADQSNDDKLAVLSQLFWIAVSLLESDYDYEFLLATRLLDKVLSRLPLDRPDALDKLEKLQQQLKWRGFPGVHALLLKGCTSPTLYEPALTLLSRLTKYTHLQVIDPSPIRAGFAMNVMALLPYMLHHYEDANALCIQAAESIAQECSHEGKQLQNLATVMTLYSRRNFSKESFQWTKCVVKYLHDSYSTQAAALLAFLVEILEKGPVWAQCPVLNIVYCLLHYTDITAPPHTTPVTAELLSVIAKHMEGIHWKEALRILKLAVTGSSSLVLPPSSIPLSTASPTRGGDAPLDPVALIYTKKELPGRTMEFTFDLTQTPVIGRRLLQSQTSTVSSTTSSAVSSAPGDSLQTLSVPDGGAAGLVAAPPCIEGMPPLHSSVSPRRCSVAPFDTAAQAAVPWRRPWQSQARVRECLVNLLNTCGQRVGLPKSPSVIFSQSSELERQSSMASSTEEVSAGGAGGGDDRTPADDITSSENQFAVFKDFDFLEYELESQGEESVDNFNLWGVRRRSPTNSSAPLAEPPHPQPPSQQPQDPPSPASPPSPPPEPDWWGDEDGSASPVDDASLPTHTDSHPGLGKTIPAGGLNQEGSAPEGTEVRGAVSPSHHPPDNLELNTPAVGAMRPPSRGSLSDESSEGDLGELTPCNAPASLVFPTRPPEHPLHSCWRAHLSALTQLGPSGLSAPAYSCALFSALFAECVNKTYSAVREAAPLLGQLGSATSALVSNLEAVGCVSPLPYVYLDGALLEQGGVASKVRSSFIALHEHTDTFLDKLDTALMVVDALRGSVMKVSVTSDSGDSTTSRGCSEEQQVEVCRALYRLHFQVSLLYDTYAKMLLLLLHAARHTPATDHSVELSALRAKLVAAAEQLDATPPCSPAPHLLHRHLPEGEECESDSVWGETDACSLDEDVGGESTSSLISSYHPPPSTGQPTTLPTPTHSSGTSTYAPASLPTPTLSTSSSTFPLITTPTLSMASTLPTMPSLPQANHKVLQLVANQKWREVVLYSDENSTVWQQPGMPHHNITTVLNIYCTYLAEKQPGMIAVCCTEQYLSETSQQLADANLAALAALRVLETEQQQLQQQGQSGFLSSSMPAQQHPTLYSTAAGSMSPMSSNATQAGALFSSAHQSVNSSQHSTLQSVLQPSSLSNSQAGAATLTRRSQSPHSSISGDEPCVPSSNPPHLSSPIITQPQSPELASLSQSYSSRISHSSPATSPLRSAGLPTFTRQKSNSPGVPLASPPHPLTMPLASPSHIPHSPSLSLASPTLAGANALQPLSPRQLSSLDQMTSSADFSTSSLPPPAGDSPVSCEPQLTVSQPSTPRRSTQC